MLEKFTRWVTFGVLAALVPLAAKYLALEINRAPVSLNEIVQRGELLLLTAAMCTAAIGELIGSGSSAKVRKILAGGGAVLSMLGATLYFSYVSTAWAGASSVDSAAILRTSIALYVFALLSSGSCILLSEMRDG